MTIPFYNLRNTFSADINRALRRDLKFDKNNMTNTVLAQYDLSQGQAEAGAEDLYTKLQYIASLFIQLSISKPKVRPADNDTIIKYDNLEKVQSIRDVLIKLQRASQDCKDILEKIIPFFNHISIDLVNRINLLSERIYNNKEINVLFRPNIQNIVSYNDRNDPTKFLDIGSLVSSINTNVDFIKNSIDDGIRNYNEIANNSQGGPQRLIAVDALKSEQEGGYMLRKDETYPFMI